MSLYIGLRGFCGLRGLSGLRPAVYNAGTRRPPRRAYVGAWCGGDHTWILEPYMDTGAIHESMG